MLQPIIKDIAHHAAPVFCCENSILLAALFVTFASMQMTPHSPHTLSIRSYFSVLISLPLSFLLLFYLLSSPHLISFLLPSYLLNLVTSFLLISPLLSFLSPFPISSFLSPFPVSQEMTLTRIVPVETSTTP